MLSIINNYRVLILTLVILPSLLNAQSEKVRVVLDQTHKSIYKPIIYQLPKDRLFSVTPHKAFIRNMKTGNIIRSYYPTKKNNKSIGNFSAAVNNEGTRVVTISKFYDTDKYDKNSVTTSFNAVSEVIIRDVNTNQTIDSFLYQGLNTINVYAFIQPLFLPNSNEIFFLVNDKILQSYNFSKKKWRKTIQLRKNKLFRPRPMINPLSSFKLRSDSEGKYLFIYIDNSYMNGRTSEYYVDCMLYVLDAKRKRVLLKKVMTEDVREIKCGEDELLVGFKDGSIEVFPFSNFKDSFVMNTGFPLSSFDIDNNTLATIFENEIRIFRRKKEQLLLNFTIEESKRLRSNISFNRKLHDFTYFDYNSILLKRSNSDGSIVKKIEPAYQNLTGRMGFAASNSGSIISIGSYAFDLRNGRFSYSSLLGINSQRVIDEKYDRIIFPRREGGIFFSDLYFQNITYYENVKLPLNSVDNIALSNSSTHLALGSPSNTDVATFELSERDFIGLRHKIKLPHNISPNPYSRLSFSPDSKYLAVAGNKLSLIDIQTGDISMKEVISLDEESKFFVAEKLIPSEGIFDFTFDSKFLLFARERMQVAGALFGSAFINNNFSKKNKLNFEKERLRIMDLATKQHFRFGNYQNMDRNLTYIDCGSNPLSSYVSVGYHNGDIDIWLGDFGLKKPFSTLTSPQKVPIRKIANQSFRINNLIGLLDDNSINLWNMLNQELICTIHPFFFNGVVIVTPDSYYHSSGKIPKSIHFVKGIEDYNFAQFDLKYNRPDIILMRMGHTPEKVVKAYYKAYQKRLEKMNFTEAMLSDDFHVPKIAIQEETIPITTSSAQLRLRVAATDNKQLLDRINVYINDVPIYGRNGINLRPLNTQQYESVLDLTLSEGENKIQVSTLNQGGAESLKETIYITYDTLERKPNLYVIGIGVSEFKNSNMNLTYPLQDVMDISNHFQQQNHTYNKVFVEELLNDEVTTTKLKQLKTRLQNTHVDDKVILYVAGHGIIDDNLDYYYATSTTNFQNPKQNGIAYELLEDLLDGIPARQKLMLMDACHSGEIDKESVELIKAKNTTAGKVIFRSFADKVPTYKQLGLENSFELMKQLFVDLRRGTGATVISSASGVEFAMEGAKWQNGVFTYALLDGLENKTADLNKDGKIMVSELQRYLAKTVPELTNNHQRPTMRVENITNDWRVW